MNWFFWRRKKKVVWEIRPIDQHLNPLSQEQSFVVRDGWEPFGISSVPNTLDPNQLRIWTRKREGDKRYREYEIKIANAGWGGHEVFLHLTDSWEPLAVSISPPDQPIIWFRRNA